MVLSVCCVVMQIAQNTVADFIIGKIAANPTKFYNLSLLVSWELLNSSALGFLVFLFNLRMLRILKFSRRLSMFVEVLHEIFRNGISFGSFFFIIFACFAQAFSLLFFSRVYSYAGILRTFETLFTLLLGTFYLALFLNSDLIAMINLDSTFLFTISPGVL